MKNILLFSLLFALISANAQTLTFTSGDSLYISKTSTDINESINLYGRVESDATSAVSVNWRIDSVYNPNSLGLSVCDTIYCLDIIVGNETNTFSMDPNVNYPMKGTFTPAGVAGEVYLKVKVVVVGSSDAPSYIIYKGDIEVDIADGISTFETTTISIFPNPTASYINVNVNGAEKINKIVVYNVIGKVVELVNTVSSNNTINVKDFDNGLYIVKLFGENETLFHTQSFVKK